MHSAEVLLSNTMRTYRVPYAISAFWIIYGMLKYKIKKQFNWRKSKPVDIQVAQLLSLQLIQPILDMLAKNNTTQA
jgi:hypothetical protein